MPQYLIVHFQHYIVKSQCSIFEITVLPLTSECSIVPSKYLIVTLQWMPCPYIAILLCNHNAVLWHHCNITKVCGKIAVLHWDMAMLHWDITVIHWVIKMLCCIITMMCSSQGLTEQHQNVPLFHLNINLWHHNADIINRPCNIRIILKCKNIGMIIISILKSRKCLERSELKAGLP